MARSIVALELLIPLFVVIAAVRRAMWVKSPRLREAYLARRVVQLLPERGAAHLIRG